MAIVKNLAPRRRRSTQAGRRRPKERTCSDMKTARLVIMGVSGSGKTTTGQAIANRLALPFVDGDDLHPRENKQKMASGTPLTDADREPWLNTIGEKLAQAEDGLVIVCSALKKRYRDTIRNAAPDTVFIHLEGSQELIESRIAHRDHEFMPSSLLASQFTTLEPLEHAEAHLVVSIENTPSEIAQQVADHLDSEGYRIS